MGFLKAVIFLAFLISITGCAIRTKSLAVAETDKAAFYVSATDPKLVTLFLTCGKYLSDNEPTTFMDENPRCDFAINGKLYSQLDKGQVGRVDVPSGKVVIDTSQPDSSIKDPPRTLEFAAGQRVLLASGINLITSKSVKQGAPFGLVGMAIAAAANAGESDEKAVHYPLTVYTSEKDFMPMVKIKEPKQMFVTPNPK
ncbi:MAG TPA: hypothetical protein VIE65_08135 [Methylobacter sp.]